MSPRNLRVFSMKALLLRTTESMSITPLLLLGRGQYWMGCVFGSFLFWSMRYCGRGRSGVNHQRPRSSMWIVACGTFSRSFVTATEAPKPVPMTMTSTSMRFSPRPRWAAVVPALTGGNGDVLEKGLRRLFYEVSGTRVDGGNATAG